MRQPRRPVVAMRHGAHMRLRARRAGPRPPRKRRWPGALAVIGVLLAAWMLWPREEQGTGLPSAEKARPGLKLAAAGPGKPEPVAPRKAAPPPAPSKKPPQPSPLLRARRDLLLAAIRARAPSLRPCVPGNAQEAHVPVQLHVLRAGAVKSVEFAGDPPAKEIRDCVRRVARGWDFKDVELPSDVELFATLALTPGA